MDTFLEEAKQLKNEFKIREALIAFEKAYDEDSSCLEAIANIGLCHMMIGNLDKSKAAFDKAIALNSEDDLIRLYINLLNIAIGTDFDADFMQKSDLDVAEQLMSSAEMFYMIRLKQEAFRLFEYVVSELKDVEWFNFASNQYRIVTMLARFEFFAEAKDIADNLVQENEKTWHGYAAMAQIELEQGNLVEAKSLFKKAIQNGGDQDPLVVSAIADTRLLEIPKKPSVN